MNALPQPPHGNAPLTAWASWAADVGRTTKAFKIFPIEAGGKSPRFKGWQGSASWDRKTVETTWTDYPDSNIGLAIQPGAVAIDADLYKPGNEALLAQFEKDFERLPDTLEFCSARGGFHLIYTTTRNLGNGTGSLPKFGDVRGFGGYLVGPGSTFEGKPYTVSDVTMPVALPPHVDAMLQERRGTTAAEREPPPGVMLDDPQNIARYTLWLLNEARLGISGVDGNNTLAATAAMGASYALSEDETVHLMVEHWNARQDDPWQPEEIEKFGGSGYRSSTSKFGNMAALNPKALGFSAVSSSDSATPVGDLWRTMADIPGPAPAREWASGDDADGWVPLGGITFLYGPGGVGKTALVGQWALAQARGEPLFGTIPMRKMPVILLAAEDDADEMHRRFEAQGRRPGDDVSFAAVRGMDTALHPPFRKEGGEDTWLFRLLDHKLASMPTGPKLAILDNLAQIYQGNYFEPSEIIRFLNSYLGRLSQKHEATIIVLAHPSESQRTSGDGGYGGVQWSAGVRARLYFERHMAPSTVRGGKPTPIGRERVLSRKKANYADDASAGMVLDWDNWKFVPVQPKPSNPFTAVEQPKRERRDSAAENVVLTIVQKAVEEAIASNPTKRWTSRELATDASYRLGKGPNRLVPDTIRKLYLPMLIAMAHPAYDNLGQCWRSVTVH